MWGAEPFWGLGYDWGSDWSRMPAGAAHDADNLEQEMRATQPAPTRAVYPRRNLQLLASTASSH